MRAIETMYRGYRFRSRLEARWAVYFDALGIKWDYELQGYDLGDGILYLPDFWLPQVRMWAEVKAEPLTPAEVEACRRLAVCGTGKGVLALVGPPQAATYCGFAPCPARDRNRDRCGPDCLTCDGSGRYVTDFLVTDYHNYVWSEHRFYACSGHAIPADYSPIPVGGDYEWMFRYSKAEAAIVAARSARFEHGEQPAL